MLIGSDASSSRSHEHRVTFDLSPLHHTGLEAAFPTAVTLGHIDPQQNPSRGLRLCPPHLNQLPVQVNAHLDTFVLKLD